MSKIRQIREVPSFSQLPRPVYVRLEQWGEQGSCTHWHQHPWGQFSYAASGVLTVLTRNARYVAPPQFAIWVPAHVEHQVLSVTPTKMRSLYIDVNQFVDSRWASPHVLEVTPLVRELIGEFSIQPILWPLHSAPHRLARVLLDQIAQLPDARLQLPIPYDRRLQLICEKLQNQPDNQETMQQLATEAGISARNMSRLFKEQTGMNFRKFRQQLRMMHALDCLSQKMDVTTVALACGYESLSAFVVAFREHFGVTPGRYFQQD